MTNKERFRRAIELVKLVQGTAEDKADVFEALSTHLEKVTGGSWQSHRFIGTDGSHIFIGHVGEVLVIDTVGRLFRGRLSSGAIDMVSANKGTPKYHLLRLIS